MNRCMPPREDVLAALAARRLLHVERIPIRWGDMDAMGHVNNVNYFRYMEQARIGWLDGMRDILDADRLSTVVVSTQCNYRKPLVYPGNVDVHVYLGEVGGSSVTTYYALRLAESELVFADGSAVVVWVGPHNGKAVRVPAVLRERLRS